MAKKKENPGGAQQVGLKHPVPTEEEVKNALNAPSLPLRKKSQLFNLMYTVAALCVGFLSMLFRDEHLPRKHSILKKIFFWHRHAGMDRAFVICCCALIFVFLALLLERNELLYQCRTYYRTQRRELLTWWKTTYRNRHRIFFQYVVLFGQMGVAGCCWRLLILVTQCEAPIVVVLSGSMETAFYRGDILFLTNHYQEQIIPGEIVVFKIENRDIPIVHRCMQVHYNETVNGAKSSSASSALYLTKGDNNNGNDRPLYAPGQFWLERKDIMGRARFFVPYLGMITVKINEYPMVKMAVVIGMLIMTIYTKEL